MPSDLSWEREVLPNGLTVLLYPRPSAMTAQLSVAIKYGSNDDGIENIGTAHFLEHMLVGGSQKRIKLHHEIEKLGGLSYFETSSECTFTRVDVFPERIAQSSKILSELLFDSKIERDKVEIERKVILNEIAEAADDPIDKIMETLLKSIFKSHPVRNPIAGTKKTVKQLTIRQLEQSHQKYYVPEDMVLILTGNFSVTDKKAILENFEGRKNNGTVSRATASLEDGKPKKETKIKRSGITQAYICFGFRTVPATDPDVPALDLIDAILGTGESARLFVELREKRALTYDLGAINISGLDYGFFAIDCAVKPNALKQTQTIILGELEKLKTQPVPKAELEKSKNLLIANHYRTIDDSHELPILLADSEIHYKDAKALQDYLNKIAQLSPQDITEIANKYFKDENYAWTILTGKR
jgi:zinc protease